MRLSMAKRAMAPRARLAKKEMTRASPSFSSRNRQFTTGAFSAARSTAPKYSWLAQFTIARCLWPTSAASRACDTRGPQKS